MPNQPPTTPPTPPPAPPLDFAALQAAVEREVTVDQSAVKAFKELAAHLTKLSTQPSVAPADLAALAKKLNDSAGALAAAIATTPPEH